MSWAGTGTNPHFYEECSGKGVCDTTTGECRCNSGFEGKACDRKRCPADCNGRGVCTPIASLDAVTAGIETWDAERVQTCVCDHNFFGPSCNKRRCPYGDDPFTYQTPGSGTTSSRTDQKKMTQEVTFKIKYEIAGPYDGGSGAGNYWPPIPSTSDVEADYPAMASDIRRLYSLQQADNDAASAEGAPVRTADDEKYEQMVLKWQDVYNHTFVAPTISNVFDQTTANLEGNVERALESLPNKAVKDVDVSVVAPGPAPAPDTANRYQCDTSSTACSEPQVTFRVELQSDDLNGNLVGKQNLLQCPYDYSCAQAGCRPKVQAPFALRYVGHDAEHDYGTSVVRMAPINYNANPYHAHQDKKIVTITDDSDPRLPYGGVSNTREAGTNRFDVRILVVVVDIGDGNDDDQDLWYHSVGYYDGTTDTADSPQLAGGDYAQEIRFKPSETNTANQKQFPTLDDTASTNPSFTIDNSGNAGGTTMTSHGPLPDTAHTRIPVPEAPGIYLNFPDSNMVADDRMRVFEITYKLAECTVSEVTANQKEISKYVELMECSGRGECDYSSGECECHQGYYGNACSKRTTLV